MSENYPEGQLEVLRVAYRQLQADLAAAQAVIEQAPHARDCGWRPRMHWSIPEKPCTCWKSQSSSSALAAHDAEVKAQGVESAQEYLVLHDQFSDRTLRLLDDLSQALRDEQETT